MTRNARRGNTNYSVRECTIEHAFPNAPPPITVCATCVRRCRRHWRPRHRAAAMNLIIRPSSPMASAVAVTRSLPASLGRAARRGGFRGSDAQVIGVPDDGQSGSLDAIDHHWRRQRCGPVQHAARCARSRRRYQPCPAAPRQVDAKSGDGLERCSPYNFFRVTPAATTHLRNAAAGRTRTRKPCWARTEATERRHLSPVAATHGRS